MSEEERDVGVVVELYIDVYGRGKVVLPVSEGYEKKFSQVLSGPIHKAQSRLRAGSFFSTK